MPAVTVIIRLYNGIEYLEESLQSVLNQTFTDWNLLVGVNGHGPDGNSIHVRAIDICSKSGDPRVRVKNYPQVRGGAAALNALVADAEAEWIANLDVDDKWEADKLELQIDLLGSLSPQPDVIGTWCRYFGSMGGSPVIPGGIINNNEFRRVNPIINSSILIRKNLASFTDMFFGLDDYDLWCKLAKEGKLFFNIPKHLVWHRIHLSSSFNSSKRQDPDAVRRYYFG